MSNNIEESIDDSLNEKQIHELKSEFTESVYRKLPMSLKRIVAEFPSGMEKALVLFASLICISGVLPNYFVMYDKRRYEANLFGIVIGQFGSGKGLINICRQLISPIHKTIIEKNKEYREWYKEHANDDPKPDKPRDKMLLIPGNITKSKFISILEENSGRGVIVDTEADTISTANKSEHGNYSDIYRKVYEHEEVSISRKQDGSQSVESTYVSVLLSCTPNQVPRFFTSLEDGLISRFATFFLASDRAFKNVFDSYGINPYKVIKECSEDIQSLYDALSELDEEGVEFSFTEQQILRFQKYFSTMKEEYFSVYGSTLDGVVHRLGTMFTKIAMILSMLRIFEKDSDQIEIPRKIVCTDDDFKTAMNITNTLSENAHDLFSILAKGKNINQTNNAVQRAIEKGEKMEKAIAMYGDEGHKQSYIATTLGVVPSTISKWLKKAGLKDS